MASLGISLPLHAHGDLPYLKQIFLQDGELQGGAASYGLLTFEEDPALWTTEDTLPSEPRLYHRLATGGLLAAGFKGLFKTHNQGCQWSAVPGFEDHVISSLIAVPDTPSTLFLTTASRHQENAVFVSRDHGATWDPLGLPFPDLSLQSVLVTPEEDRLWVAGNTLEEWKPVVLTFTSQTNKWEPLPLDLSAWDRFTLLEYSHQTNTILAGARTQSGQATLLTSSDTLESLERAGDVGEGTITDVATLGDLRFVTTREETGAPHLWRSEGRSPFREVEGPRGCLERGNDGVLWGCGTLASGGHLLRTEDGERWTPLAPFERSCPRSCPPHTDGGHQNPIAAKQMETFGIGDTCDESPASPSPAPPEGGCQGGPRPRASLGSLLCLALGFFLFRRRASRAP